jgi:putative redox protein
MQHLSELNWVDDLKFDVLQNGKTFRVDGNQDETASTGFRPKALILSSLAGCTGIDVVELLKKMRVKFSDFNIKVSGNLTEEHPKVYDVVVLTYSIRLANEGDREKVQKAIDLSQEKYCGVSAMVRKFAQLDIVINYL